MSIKPIKPDPQDFETVERECGRLPPNASTADHAHHYRLAQMAKLRRLYEHGKLPLELMREFDQIAAEQRKRKR